MFEGLPINGQVINHVGKIEKGFTLFQLKTRFLCKLCLIRENCFKNYGIGERLSEFAFELKLQFDI